jgi:hypothetical protein
VFALVTSIDLGKEPWGEHNSLGAGSRLVGPCSKGRARPRVWPPRCPSYKPWPLGLIRHQFNTPRRQANIRSYDHFILARFAPPNTTNNVHSKWPNIQVLHTYGRTLIDMYVQRGPRIMTNDERTGCAQKEKVEKTTYR